MPPTKRKCRECTAAGLEDCKHCICPGCNWCMFRVDSSANGRAPSTRPAQKPMDAAPALATLAILSSKGDENRGVAAATCGALREAGGSVRCRSCRRHNVKKRKADQAAAAAKRSSPATSPSSGKAPTPTAQAIPGGSGQGCFFPTGIAEQPPLASPPLRILGAAAWPSAAPPGGHMAFAAPGPPPPPHALAAAPPPPGAPMFEATRPGGTGPVGYGWPPDPGAPPPLGARGYPAAPPPDAAYGYAGAPPPSPAPAHGYGTRGAAPICYPYSAGPDGDGV